MPRRRGRGFVSKFKRNAGEKINRTRKRVNNHSKRRIENKRDKNRSSNRKTTMKKGKDIKYLEQLKDMELISEKLDLEKTQMDIDSKERERTKKLEELVNGNADDIAKSELELLEIKNAIRELQDEQKNISQMRKSDELKIEQEQQKSSLKFDELMESTRKQLKDRDDETQEKITGFLEKIQSIMDQVERIEKTDEKEEEAANILVKQKQEEERTMLVEQEKERIQKEEAARLEAARVVEEQAAAEKARLAERARLAAAEKARLAEIARLEAEIAAAKQHNRKFNRAVKTGQQKIRRKKRARQRESERVQEQAIGVAAVREEREKKVKADARWRPSSKNLNADQWFKLLMLREKFYIPPTMTREEAWFAALLEIKEMIETDGVDEAYAKWVMQLRNRGDPPMKTSENERSNIIVSKFPQERHEWIEGIRNRATATA